MSHYTLEELIELWRREKLTVEQMIGQILQVLKVHEQRMREGGRLPPDERTPPPPSRQKQ